MNVNCKAQQPARVEEARKGNRKQEEARRCEKGKRVEVQVGPSPDRSPHAPAINRAIGGPAQSSTPPPPHPIHNRTQTREARKQIMQSVARLVARSARSSAEHNCSRRKLASTARCGGGGGTKEEILKVPQSSAATMAEPAAGDAATRSRTASQVATGIAQGERFFVGYCVVVYGSLLGLVLRRFRRA